MFGKQIAFAFSCHPLGNQACNPVTSDFKFTSSIFLASPTASYCQFLVPSISSTFFSSSLLHKVTHNTATYHHFSNKNICRTTVMTIGPISTITVPGRPTWQQTMLRIKDPQKSLKFYVDILGFTLIDKFDFPQYEFSLYFLTTLKEDQVYDLVPGTQEAHDYLWSMEGVTLELTHNYGTENQEEFSYHPGNQEKDGYGHVAVNCNDVYAAAEKLEKAGCTFKKKPDEGRMKGLAFVFDPDGYWVELVKRGEGANISIPYNFSQTMLRVKDPKKSLDFYQSLGMKLLKQLHFDSFSLYYLGSSNVAADFDVASMFNPVLELTHNHGSENDENFKYFNGNEQGRQGFGHVGFLVDDVYKACDAIAQLGYGFRKKPDGGSMKGLAFAYDPDGYSVEIIKRGGIDFGDQKVASK